MHRNVLLAPAIAGVLASSLLLACNAPRVLAQPAVTPLLANGDFEADANGDGWPDGWGKLKAGGSYETEGGNHFLRIKAPEPNKLTLLYQQVRIPANTKALEIKWKWRATDLKPGTQPWFDARIMLDFKNAEGQKIKGAPGAPNLRKDTTGWVERSIKFLVPEGATMLEFMPCLFQVEQGTLDLDDIVIRDASDAAGELASKAPQASATVPSAPARNVPVAADGNIIPNGNFQKDDNNDGIPDQWGGGKEGQTSWVVEGDNRFLRITAPEPDKMVLYYREIPIPANTPALQFTWKQRVTDLKPGKNAWFDARIMMNWKGAGGQKITPSPSAPYTRKDTGGWVERSVSFLVPAGALSLELMPCLFQVERGTFDLDDLVLKATDPAPLQVAAKEREEDIKASYVAAEKPDPARWPRELKVAGNKVLAPDGKEVWLQGVNVESLEFLVRGDHVEKATVVAVEDWKSNVIRLPVKEEYWFGKDPTQKDGGAEYRALVDRVITLAANRGAYVLLDLHRFRAPKKIHADFWKDAATKYKNNPAVLFDLFNEPHGISWDVWKNGGFVEDKNAPADEDAFLTPEEKALNAKGFHSVGMQALVDTVRGTGARNIVIVGALDWAYDLSGIAKGYALDDRGGNGIIYASHIYAGKKDWQNKVLVVADKYPIILSELGANTKKFEFIPANQQEDATTWVPAILGLIQKYKFHWTAFCLHPKSAPQLITDWKFTPTPEWGVPAKRALAGERFALDRLR